MEETPAWNSRKTWLVFGATVFLVLVAGAGGWFYYSLRQPTTPLVLTRPPQAVHPYARLMPAPQETAAPGGTDSQPSTTPDRSTPRPSFHVERDSMKEFRQQTELSIERELAADFPELPSILNAQDKIGSDPAYRRVAFQLLDASKAAPAERRPVILFAADLVARPIFCDTFGVRDKLNEACPQLVKDLARYDIQLKNDELGGGLYYPRTLLWRIWEEYPQTKWGERAFVLLLDRGWDTSVTCEKGDDQTREVIRQGETFLRQRPESPYRVAVTLLVAEAYASRWSLSKESSDGGTADYVDPKEFQAGAEEARLKAIVYFEEAVKLAPGTKLSTFAEQIVPALRDQQVLDNYRFFCVYD